MRHLCQPKFRLRSCTQCNQTLADAMKNGFGLILFRGLQNHKILQPHHLIECYSCHMCLCSHSSNNTTQPRVDTQQVTVSSNTSCLTECLCSHSSENTTQPWVDTQQLIVSSNTSCLTVPTAPKTQLNHG